MKAFTQLENASKERTLTSDGSGRLLASQGGASTISSQRAEASEDHLDSWKEIASYLGREVRTVQRWEKRESLPVHRHFHHAISSVYAFKTEIDKWRSSRSASLSAAVSPRSGLSAVRAKTLLPAQLEKQFTSPCETNNPLSQGENGNFVHAIIFITRELPVLPKELQSLHLGKTTDRRHVREEQKGCQLGSRFCRQAKGIRS